MAAWFAIGILYFALIGRHQLDLSPEEYFAMEQQAKILRNPHDRHAEFDALKNAAAQGLVDTVIVAFVDMFGRLVGKRFHAEHFVETAWAETHACNYLLANDIDMEPVPGYQRRQLGSRLRRLCDEARPRHAALDALAASARHWCSPTCRTTMATTCRTVRARS